jgi:hypothetical protein
MKGKMAVLGAAIALLLVVVQVQAHHPFDTEFDADKPITLKGTVTKVEWGNPHVSISMDAKDAAGAVTNWTFELGPPSRLRNFAWKKDTLKAGDEITNLRPKSVPTIRNRSRRG